MRASVWTMTAMAGVLVGVLAGCSQFQVRGWMSQSIADQALRAEARLTAASQPDDAEFAAVQASVMMAVYKAATVNPFEFVFVAHKTILTTPGLLAQLRTLALDCQTAAELAGRPDQDAKQWADRVARCVIVVDRWRRGVSAGGEK